MVTEVKRFQTSDGALFEKRKEAELHETKNEICEYLDISHNGYEFDNDVFLENLDSGFVDLCKKYVKLNNNKG